MARWELLPCKTARGEIELHSAWSYHVPMTNPRLGCLDTWVEYWCWKEPWVDYRVKSESARFSRCKQKDWKQTIDCALARNAILLGIPPYRKGGSCHSLGFIQLWQTVHCSVVRPPALPDFLWETIEASDSAVPPAFVWRLLNLL